MGKNQVIVRNTCIEVTNYQKGDCEKLEDYFKKYDPLTHRYNYFGIYFDKENKRMFLPRGIDIWFVKKALDVRDHITQPNNPYMNFEREALLKYKPRDDEQFQALNFMCGLTEEYHDNLYLPQLSVNLVTGKGKTYCSIATMCFFQIKAIVITASTSLLKQWTDDIKEYTNLDDKDIMFINGADTMNVIAMGKSNKAKTSSIFLISHATIRSYANTYGWDKLNRVFLSLGIGVKIIDEAHTNFENILMMDFFTNVWKTYYVTATPKRSNKSEDRIYQLSLKNVPDIDLFNPDEDPHTDYLAIKWNSKPSPKDISRCSNMYGLDRNKYIDYITKNPEFYKMMYIVMDLVLKCKGRVLIYIGTNEAILRVYEWICNNYPELIGDVGVFTSLMDTRAAKLKEREKKIILSTTKSAGLGEDIKGLKMTVVLAEPFKSEVLARQSLGRTRDKDTMYVELVDMGFKYIKNFYLSKLPVFNKYASSTEHLFIDSYELNARYNRLKEDRDEYIGLSPISFYDKRFNIGCDLNVVEYLRDNTFKASVNNETVNNNSNDKIITPIHFIEKEK